MLKTGHALVIDDKQNDGMIICSVLIENFTPCYFFQYDERKVLEHQEQQKPKLTGIRLIFQDLALTSQGEPSKTDYDAAALTIETIISEQNGPWLLVTWSTWAGAENNLGTQKAEEVFNHLRENLPPGLRPFAFVVLDTKPMYSKSGLHGELQAVSEISPELITHLSDHIKEKTAQHPATTALIEWETEVFRAISETVSEITSFIQPGNNFDSDLGSILRELSLAEIGKNISPENLSRGLKEVLSSILRDKIKSTACGIENFGDINEDQTQRLINWKAKTNRIIHLETSALSQDLPPGSIVELSHNPELAPGNFQSKEDLEKFIRPNFFQFDNTDNRATKNRVSTECSIIALDLTPPCDHAQNKSPWNKYIIGLLVPEANINYCRAPDRINGGRTNKLLGDYLLCLPEMMNQEGGKYFLVLNSKLIFSIDKTKANNVLKEHYKGRLREQILSDITSWLIRQSTRPGIVELR
ncbi:MAG: hypothetical protein VCA57_12090 [Pseudomonas sp.]|uniref:hypothetical protein n=1 Tax=Pseudomonas sp. TaxID=306 RepID=UPI0039819F41